MSEVAENKNPKSGKPDELLGANEKSQEIKRIYDFVNFVYGKSNAERLSKIIDKVVKTDMEKFFKNKTDDEIGKKFAEMKANTNPSYTFEQSVYSALKRYGYGVLMEPIIWHMVLLDILNIKFGDLDLKDNKSLEEAITGSLKKNSDNRLDFLFSPAKPYEFETVGGAMYQYSKRIFKNLPEKKNTNPEQEQLMRKIFACFLRVSFYKMKQMASPESYEYDDDYYKKYREAISSFSRYFYIDTDDYHSDYVKSNTKDMAAYLFSIGELETLFNVKNYNDLDYFCFSSDHSYYPRGRNHWMESFHFLYYFDTKKPLEQLYKEDKDEFIQNFFPGKKNYWIDKWTSVDHIGNILAYFNDNKLLKEAKDYLIEYFKIDEKYTYQLDKSIQCSKEQIREMKKENKIDQTRLYFCDIINGFTDGQKYSNGLVEDMSVMLCREKDNVTDIQQSSQKNNDSKLLESPSVNENEKDIANEEEKKEEEQEDAEQEKERKEKTALSKDDRNFNKSTGSKFVKNENSAPNNHTKNELKTKNSNKNWFFSFVRAVLNFFHGIGSKIYNFFCRQPKKIDNVGSKNNSFVSNIKDMQSKGYVAPKTNNLNSEKRENI